MSRRGFVLWSHYLQTVAHRVITIIHHQHALQITNDQLARAGHDSICTVRIESQNVDTSVVISSTHAARACYLPNLGHTLTLMTR